MDTIGPTKKLKIIYRGYRNKHKRRRKIKQSLLEFIVDSHKNQRFFDFNEEPCLDNNIKSKIIRPYLGGFFQTLALGIWGGEETDSIRNCFELQDGRKYAPDITHFDKDIFREIKGVSATESCDFRAVQMARTAKALTSEFPFEEPESRFCFFRYNIRRPTQFIRIASRKKCEQSIVELMKRNVIYVLDLPFPIVMALYFAGSKFGGENYCDGSRFNSKPMDNLFMAPEETLANLKPRVVGVIAERAPLKRARVSVDDFVWNRWIPRNTFYINNQRIGRPLVLECQMKDYKSWLEKFREDYSKQEEIFGRPTPFEIKEEIIDNIWFGWNV